MACFETIHTWVCIKQGITVALLDAIKGEFFFRIDWVVFRAIFDNVLSKNYWDVRVVIPDYSCIPEQYRNNFEYVTHFYMSSGPYVQDKYVGVLKYEQDGVTYYFIDNQEFFTGFSPYTSDTKFEIEKYTFFDKAVLSMLPLIDFKPDIIHCHDWQTGLLPVYLKNEFAANPFFWGIKTIITIHNLKFQGIWDREWVQGVSGLTDNLFTPD
jgi:starch synthase